MAVLIGYGPRTAPCANTLVPPSANKLIGTRTVTYAKSMKAGGDGRDEVGGRGGNLEVEEGREEEKKHHIDCL